MRRGKGKKKAVEWPSNISTEFLLLCHSNNFDNITGLVVVALSICREEKKHYLKNIYKVPILDWADQSTTNRVGT